MMAKTARGTGHEVVANLMREDISLQLETVCGRLKTDVHYTNGHSSNANGHSWLETNNNTDYKSMMLACKVVDKMCDQSGAANHDSFHFDELNGQETSCSAQKRCVEAVLDVFNGVNDGVGRKKRRRKNCQPRSLMQLNHEQEEMLIKEQLNDYRVNNNDVDFDTIADDEEEILDLSCGKKHENLSIGSNGHSGTQVTDDAAAVDLSVVTRCDNSVPEMGSVEDRTQLVDTAPVDMTTEDKDGTGTLEITETTPSSADAAVAIKDYAESTMNELLSIYGLNENEAGESITKRVPLQNFTPNNILGLGQHLHKLPSTHVTSKSVRQEVPTSNTEIHITDSATGSVSATSRVGDVGIYWKYEDNMETRAQRPQGNVVASPNVLLPTKQVLPTGLSDNPITNASESAVATATSKMSSLQGKQLVGNSFTTSSAYIKACFDSSQAPKSTGSASADSHSLLPNYGKYLKRYQCGEDCGQKSCALMAYKEHFHCLDCDFKVFVRKEEMIRHFKWHKKRDDSLQHGFMRYSSLDSCKGKFGSCTHDSRQTHYHCLQPGCNKVYISTSDVQMHANYHRKNSAIAQEGFQRFRATEDCGSLNCVFYGQRTTHFHCRRPQCNYTFKNKADMEKHKMYHQKDEILAKDGFKKFMKYESCGYELCRYSNSSNHIHCIRPGCDYVLHSTGQLYSHKRKHERRDFEMAYKSFKTQQKPVKIAPAPLHQPAALATAPSQPSAVVGHPRGFSSDEFIDIEDLAAINQSGSLNESDTASPGALSTVMDLSVSGTPASSQAESSKIFSGTSQSEESCSPILGPSRCQSLEQLGYDVKGDALGDSLSLSIPSYSDDKHMSVDEGGASECDSPARNGTAPQPDSKDVLPSMAVPAVNDRKEKNELWKKYLTRYTANDPCVARCELLYKDHYHCSVTRCGKLFRSKDGVHEHAKCHEQQEKITTLCYMTYDSNTSCDTSCPYNRRQTHYHCLWAGCMQVLTDEDPVFSLLEHQKVHEYARGVVSRRIFPSTPRVTVDAMRRRRGRPPKFPRNLIPVVPKTEMSEEEIQRLVVSLEGDTEARLVVSCGFKQFDPDHLCPDEKCMFAAEKQHYHCVRQRCYYATNRRDMLNLHARDFHSFINILDGFQFFDRSINCRRAHCHNNHVRRHFHCVRPRCDYSFVRYSTMIQHDKKHNMANMERSMMLQKKSIVEVSGSMSAVLPRASAGSDVAKPLKTIRPLIPLTTAYGPNQPKALSQSPGGTTAVAMATITPVVMQSVSSSPVTLTSSSINVSSSMTVGVVPVSSVSTLKDVTSSVPLSAVSPTRLMINNSMLSSSSNLVTIAPKPSISTTLPLTVLLQQQQLQQQQQQRVNVMSPQLSWLTLKMKMHYSMHQNCGRPFCKLKKRDHYHCNECSQAFSNPNRLKMHISKHRPKTSTSTIQCDTAPVEGTPDASSSSDAKFELSSSLNLSLTTFSNLLSKEQPTSVNDYNNDDSDGLVIDLSLPTSECGDTCSTIANIDDDRDKALDISQVKCQVEVAKEYNVVIPAEIQPASAGRRQDGVPEGYVRFRHVEDCGFVHCTYRHTVTHYHCARPTCGHAFSDRARTQQHTKRHQRTDAIMADDFEHFRIHIDCRHLDCEHASVTSHYHCQRCSFVCTDTAKVIAHRKHHLKLKKVEVQGYRKFTKREMCTFEWCSYSGKQCHYHCLEEGCSQTMLGSAQMAAHRNRHSEASLCKDKHNNISLTNMQTYQ